ncbi:helix-turn-helix transcriptional regulator [Minwuia thermotolerans]|uniref:Helix-turn-helix domain-containing protein n=1 Tax=Minwuia thermotolerans TaxID=2056226 RepID=A0A2M9G2G8_9PROT|nr:helix-turn-helix domain-containing protein [Minwuia thermotolerans]PJK29890.1 hypothetical protein CVT23_08930 [Minwuia thermotolerans]
MATPENLTTLLGDDFPLAPEAAATLLGVTPRTLKAWRATDFGPTPTRIGRRVAYRVGDVRAFLREAAEQGAAA